MVIYNSKPNLHAKRDKHTSKPIRLPSDLTQILSAEEKAEYNTLSFEDKDSFLRSLLPLYLQAKGVDLHTHFTCPKPEHNDPGPSALYYDDEPPKVHCYGECLKDYSIFDICWFDFFYREDEIQDEMPNEDLPGVKQKLEELFGLRESLVVESTATDTVPSTPAQPTEPLIPATMDMQCTLPVYADEATILEKWRIRGILKRTVERFNLGYNAEKDMLVIPTPPGWFGRFLNPANPSHKADRPSGVPIFPFNYSCLYEGDQPIFIVEGEIDALSIMQVPRDSFNNTPKPQAIGLGGVNQVNKLIKIIDGLPREQRANLRLILALDADDAGQKTNQELADRLKARGIRHWCPCNIYNKYKDANEFLLADWKGLNAIIWFCQKKAFEEMAEPADLPEDEVEPENTSDDKTPEERKYEYIQQSSQLSFLPSLRQVLADPNAHTVKPTGLTSWDKALGGGIKSELYVIGACSSLGKTTCTHQIAENLAKAGNDILFYSLEMSQESLMFKTLTRLDYISEQKVLDLGTPLSAGDLYNWSKNYHSRNELDRLESLIQSYESSLAARMFIKEADGTLTAADIRADVEKHREITNNTPVIILDYLQILGSPNERWDTKKVVDYNISELKRISRDFDTPVILISSLNRANYTEKISMQAFKESGSVEYGCDVLLGLQLKGLAAINLGTAVGKKLLRALESAVDYQKAAGKELALELRVLKNRNGITGAYDLGFNSRSAYFNSTPNIQEWMEIIFRHLPSNVLATEVNVEAFLNSLAGYQLSKDYLRNLNQLDRLCGPDNTMDVDEQEHPPLPTSKFGRQSDSDLGIPTN